MKRLLILVLAFAAFAGMAYAHNGMLHVMGTVVSIANDSITIKATDGKTQMVTLVPTTKYFKGENAASRQDIKIGQHVVVHATKKGNELLAAEVKVGAMARMRNMHGAKDNMAGMNMSGSAKH